jgi:dTDP-4-amino-4,6-dideoxygalactose transaminase
MRIPAIDLKAQYWRIQHEVDAALRGVLEGGSFILGEEVKAFEREFAAWCGVPQAVGVSSGTAALQLALQACGVETGDEVISVSHTSVATVAAIELAGGRSVLAEIEAQRMTLGPAKVSERITQRTRALVPVHLYGCPADMGPLLELAREKGLRVVEDCAQAHGARYRGRPVGGWGDAAAFSFYPTKNLGAYGDGGAVVTNNPEIAERTRLLRQYGWDEKRDSTIRGENARLDEMQAAILRVKLRFVDEWNARRKAIAGMYTRRLGGSGLTLPVEPQECAHAWHQYVVRSARRDDLRAHLAGRGIQTLIHYPVPVHLQPAYADLGYREGDLPESERAAREVLSLPIYPEMDDGQVEAVCEAILEFGG